ncbi:hypothetical protein [Methanomethylovorans hollandica]|nr:hypothetical protein [Methanomethylovorans hollandica]
MINVKFNTPLQFMNICISGILLCENIELQDSPTLSGTIDIGQISESGSICKILVSEYSNHYRSGTYVHDENGLLYSLDLKKISFFRKSLSSLDVENIRILIDRTMYEYDSCERLMLCLATHVVHNMHLESEGGQIKEFFFNEVLDEIRLDNEMNSRNELEEKILKARPLLSENVVQDLIDYIISIGAFVPIDPVI